MEKSWKPITSYQYQMAVMIPLTTLYICIKLVTNRYIQKPSQRLEVRLEPYVGKLTRTVLGEVRGVTLKPYPIGLQYDQYDYPQFESFRYRAVKIYPELRLCEWCLKSNRWCYESLNTRKRMKNWKRYRRTQWKD